MSYPDLIGRAIFLALAWLLAMSLNADAALLPSTWDGTAWSHHYAGERPLSNPSVDRDVEFALGYWNAQGRESKGCRPRVLSAPDLDGALGAAEPRDKGYVVACNLWVKRAITRPRSIFDEARLCHVIVHEVGHLYGMPHSGNPYSIMYPEYGGDAFLRRHGRYVGTDLCTRFAARHWKKPAQPLNVHAASGSLRGMKIKKPQQPKVRSHVAVDAHMRNSAGAMERGKRAKRRQDRQNTKRALRAGSED